MENPYFTKTFIYAITQSSINGMLNITYLKSDKKQVTIVSSKNCFENQ